MKRSPWWLPMAALGLLALTAVAVQVRRIRLGYELARAESEYREATEGLRGSAVETSRRGAAGALGERAKSLDLPLDHRGPGRIERP